MIQSPPPSTPHCIFWKYFKSLSTEMWKSNHWGFPGGANGRRIRLPMQKMPKMWVWSLGRDDPLEKEMATHSSILAMKISWAEKSGELQSVGLRRVGYDWAPIHRLDGFSQIKPTFVNSTQIYKQNISRCLSCASRSHYLPLKLITDSLVSPAFCAESRIFHCVLCVFWLF